MKRYTGVLIIMICILSSLYGCKSQLEWNESLDTVIKVELVSAENRQEYTVIKTLSESEMEDFLNYITHIPCRMILGDPISVHGDSIVITYESGNYEIICAHGADYVVPEAPRSPRGFIWDEDDFLALNKTFSD